LYQQPYDQLMKDMFKEDTASLLAFLLPGATFLDLLDIEVLRPPMRMDRVCRMQYKGRTCLLNLEFQADQDDDMAHRLLVYHANLWREHKLPIISLVFYLFRCSTVTSPLLEEVGEGEAVLIFHFGVCKLWECDAHKFIKEHPIHLYPWLPAMDNADADLLLWAIDNMVEYYRGKEVTLTRHILWFGFVFRRGTRLPLHERQKVEERLKMLEQLLEQDEWVLKQKALSEQKGEQIGFAKGEQKTLREMLIEIVQLRYPSLVTLAEQKVPSIRGVDVLRLAVKKMLATPDEATVRLLLNTLSD